MQEIANVLIKLATTLCGSGHVIDIFTTVKRFLVLFSLPEDGTVIRTAVCIRPYSWR